MWDNLVARKFPSEQFYDYFGLKPQHTLCEDLQGESKDSGFSELVSGTQAPELIIFPSAIFGIPKSVFKREKREKCA